MCFLEKISDCEVYFEKSLKEFCTFKIGGKAKFLVVAKNINALNQVCVACRIHNIRYKVIGFGSNLLFPDHGFNGVVIINQARKIFKRKNYVYATSGTPFFEVINFTLTHSLGGLEALAGIPATVGGAVVNNMGAFGVSVSDVIEYVEGYYSNNLNKKMRLNTSECRFAYRDSIFKHIDFLITGVKFRLQFSDKGTILKNTQATLRKKSATQPLDLPSAGSVFKRGELVPAKIIDELNLKGTKIGGAEISTKHAGFIVNKNNATAHDVLALISLINDKVFKIYKTKLDLEIEIVD